MTFEEWYNEQDFENNVDMLPSDWDIEDIAEMAWSARQPEIDSLERTRASWAKTCQRLSRENKELKDIMKQVMDVLEEDLGDTDPYIGEDWIDDDIRDECPIFWCHMTLVKALEDTP